MYYYKKIENEIILSVEAKSIDVVSPSFSEATKAEYDNFMVPLLAAKPLPPRDLEAEIEDLRTRIELLEVVK